MKKLLSIVVSLILIISLTSCSYNRSHQEKIISTFESFENSQEIIVLTPYELIVKGERYDCFDIKYEDMLCRIVHLEEDGFYSFTRDSEDTLQFLFTYYEDFETELLGTDTLPSDFSECFFADNRFGFRVEDNPLNEDSGQAYYFWSVDTKQPEIVDFSQEIMHTLEWSKDNHRSKDYTLSYNSKIIDSYLDVTHNESGKTKRIDNKAILTFEEGKELQKINYNTSFSISRVFERNGDIYFISYYEVGFLGDPCYYFVTKWNFETEKCEYYTSIYFEKYPNSIEDMYIVDSE